MVIINTVSDRYFSLNGVNYAKIYQPLKQGNENIGIYNVYDTRQQLLDSTKYDQYLVDGVVHVSQSDAIAALIPVIYLEDAVFDNRVYNYTGDLIENNITNNPDDEDLTSVGGAIRLKDREKLLFIRKGFDFTGDISAFENKDIVIRDTFDLSGATINMPTGVRLMFEGGTLYNGVIVCDNTYIDAPPCSVFDNIFLEGTLRNDFIYPEWMGARGDGVYDDTEFFNRIDGLGATIKILDKVYAVGNLDLSGSIEGNGYLKYIGGDNGYCLNVTGSDQRIICNIDCDNKNSQGVVVSGDNNILDLVVINNQSNELGSNSNYGVVVTGNDNTFNTVVIRDFANTGNPNESFPQGFAFVGSNGNIVDNIVFKNIDSSALTVGSTSVSNRVNNLQGFNCGDNGIYQLGGNLQVGNMYYDGNDEAVVNVSGSMQIDSLTVFGECASVFNISNAKSLTCNNLVTIKNEDQTYGLPSSIIRTRPTNVRSGKIVLKNINASTAIRGSSLFFFNNGSIDFVSVSNCVLETYYGNGAFGGLAFFNNIAELIINDVVIDYYDMTDTLDSSSLVTFAVGAVTKPSIIRNLDFRSFASDLTTLTSLNYRGAGFARDLIKAEGLRWRADIGPYTLNNNDDGLRDTVNGLPTTGTWKRGKILYSAFPIASGSIGWVCVTSGSPGTWKTFGVISD